MSEELLKAIIIQALTNCRSCRLAVAKALIYQIELEVAEHDSDDKLHLRFLFNLEGG